METKSSNTVWHDVVISRQQREQLNTHRGCILWFTGLSGSGKSTLIQAVDEQLHGQGCHTFTLDGDNVRHGLCSDLGFSDADRTENIRRIGEVAKLMTEAGLITLAGFISPFRHDRQRVRNLVKPCDFLEVYCQCPLDVCEQRDVKGLYKMARAGKIRDFTGISSPYEEPLHPEILLQTDRDDVMKCAKIVANIVLERTRLTEV